MARYKWIGTTSTAWATNTNWSPAGPPATSGDTVTNDQDGIAAIAASDQSATTLTAWNIKSTYTYAIGDAATPLQVSATSLRIGDPSGSSTVGAGSGRINLNLGSVASAITVVTTKNSSTDSGKEPVRIKGTSASNKLYVQGGRVGVATDNIGDAATFNTIAVTGTQTVCNIASGVTLTTLRAELGTTSLACAATTVYHDGGNLATAGSGAITTAYVAGTAKLNSTGTITTLEVKATGNASLLDDLQAKTITTVKLYPGAHFSYDPRVHTITNPIQIIGGTTEDVTINVPKNVTVAIVCV